MNPLRTLLITLTLPIALIIGTGLYLASKDEVEYEGGYWGFMKELVRYMYAG